MGIISMANKNKDIFMLSNISSNNMPEVNSISANQTNKSGNVVLARKNDPGYMKSMDFDSDGTITLEEFNQYCEENSVDANGRLKLLTGILLSKTVSEIKENIKENNPQDFNDLDKQNLSIYSDDDSSKKVSIEEYIEYYDKKYSQNEDSKQEEKIENSKDINIKKALDAYNIKEIEKPELKIDGKI